MYIFYLELSFSVTYEKSEISNELTNGASVDVDK